MTRTQVLKLRLGPTSLALGVILGTVYLLWFPGAYATLAGVHVRVAVLVLASLVFGPGLTTLVYRPGKRGIRLDIAILALLELVFVVLMMRALHERRPAYTVFAVDRFEIVMAAEVDRTLIDDPRLRRRPGHEPRLVYAEMPTDPEVYDRLLEETVFHGLPDIDRRPRHWRPYPQGIGKLRQSARPLLDLADAGDTRRAAVARWLSRRGANATEFVYLPLRGQSRDAAMVVHERTGYPAGILAVDPW